MKPFPFLTAIVFALILSACETLPKTDYANFYDHHPRSILVLPPFNKTTGVEAPIVFNTTVSKAFAERGYYVFPIRVAQDILTDLGLTDEGLISSVLPQRLKEIFGTDAILYITIVDWATHYFVISSDVTVKAEYKLVDATSGEVLWQHTESAVYLSGGAGAGGVAGLIVMAVAAAVTAAAVDYRPVAILVNNQAVSRAGHGLPAGPYHPQYKKDAEQYR